MDLTPGERALLGQLRDLYASNSKREHSLAAITRQWPPIMLEAYKGVLKGLVAKDLLQATSEGRAVTITAAGLNAMGVAVPVATASSRTLGVKAYPPRAVGAPSKPAPTENKSPIPAAAPPKASAWRGKIIAFIAIGAVAAGLTWWLSA